MKKTIFAALMLFSVSAIANDQTINGNTVVAPEDTTIPMPACETLECQLANAEINFTLNDVTRVLYVPDLDEAAHACFIAKEIKTELPVFAVYTYTDGFRVTFDCSNAETE